MTCCYKVMESAMREDMKKLWMETFNDSAEFVDMLFDAYFDKGIKLCRYSNDGNLISSMFGIPYTFRDNNTGKILCGLYLCGLATHPDYRCRGMMGGMLKEVESIATENGFDFLFLIPSSQSTRNYYLKFGYEDAFENPKEGKLPDKSNFTRIEYSELIDCRCVKNGFSEKREIEDILDFLKKMESLRVGINIIRSRDDYKIAIRDCLMSGGKICVNKCNREIIGIGFVYPDGKFYKEGEVKIPDKCSLKENGGMIKLLAVGETKIRKWEIPEIRLKNAGMSLMLD